jgi:hypothetical protein
MKIVNTNLNSWRKKLIIKHNISTCFTELFTHNDQHMLQTASQSVYY